MTTYNTKNPIGSTSPKDLFDNAQNLDVAVNDPGSELWLDRLGVSRLSWAGMEKRFGRQSYDFEKRFQQFLSTSGYQDLGDYVPGLVITSRNQVFRRDGELYRAAAALDLPYITTGDWSGEGGSFVAVGDAALRQELGTVTNDGDGAALVGNPVGGDLTRAVISVDTMAELRALPVPRLGAGRTMVITLNGYYAAGDGGGGAFYWQGNSSEVDDGGMIIQPGSFPGTGRWKRRYDVSTAVNVRWMGAKVDGIADDSEPILAALRTKRSVFAPAGISQIKTVMFPTVAGQRIYGEGDELSIWSNVANDFPLWCFGDPTQEAGPAPWSSLSSIKLMGNPLGNTVWGAFCPNGPRLSGNPYAPGQVEGMSNDPSNVYYGRLPFTPAEWNTAARGCSLNDVTIANVYGGHALHVSAWGFSASNVKLFSGKQGLRNSGSANSNCYFNLYVSSMSMEGLLHPNTDASIPTATSYINCIVQQCGPDATGRGAIALLKGQGTQFDALYLERNNERGAPADIYVSSSEIGLRLNSLRHTTDTEAVLPVIIRTEGAGTYVGSVIYAKNVAKVVHVTGTDTRTETRIDGPIRPVGTNIAVDGVVVDDSSGKRTSSFLPEVSGLSGLWLDGWTRLYKAAGKRAFRQSVSTGTEIALESHGSVRIVLDAGNNSTGQGLYIDHNGIDGAGTNLITLSASNGSFAPGASGTQSLGTPTMPWNIVYAVGGVSNPSDARRKQQIRDLTAAELRVAAAIRVRAYKLNQEVERLGDAAPVRFGVIAQEVVDLFQSEGLNALDYGAVAHESWPEIQEQRNADGAVLRPYRPAGDTYLVNYGELAAFMLSAQQSLFDRVAALESQ